MAYLKPASVEDARNKALPILLACYERHGQRRSPEERARRAQVKLDRDDRRRQKPRICSL